MAPPRITIFAGHYGTGKTNLAVNCAFELRERYDEVWVVDLDIVNPYFRTKDSKEGLERAGIRFISSAYANSNVDLPALSPESYAAFDQKRAQVVIDVGGDADGAVALGRFYDRADGEECQMLLVLNKYRPLTSDLDSTLEIMRAIESASRRRFSGLVNNSNLSCETTAEVVLASVPYAEEMARATGLPLLYHAARRDIAADLGERVSPLKAIDIYGKNVWKI